MLETSLVIETASCIIRTLTGVAGRGFGGLNAPSKRPKYGNMVPYTSPTTPTKVPTIVPVFNTAGGYLALGLGG